MTRRNYIALAIDGDGTLLRSGHMGRNTIAALKRWRKAGRKLLLATGENVKQVADFPHADLFDRIVAENGALVLSSRRGRVRTLCRPPPARLLKALKQARVWPIKRGRLVIQAKFEQENNIRRVLRQTKLRWHIIRNRRELIVLPAGVTKATGVAAALKELDVSPRQAVAIGDAENDRTLLQLCGLAVAVNNAVPKLKHKADVVTNGQYGKGVAELVDRLLANGHARTKQQRRQNPAA